MEPNNISSEVIINNKIVATSLKRKLIEKPFRWIKNYIEVSNIIYLLDLSLVSSMLTLI